MTTKLHIYTGDGKGKTTAGMGLALRMLGQGWTVLVGQFLKDNSSGELKVLGTFANAVIQLPPPMPGFWFRLGQEKQEEVQKAYSLYLEELENTVRTVRPQGIVLDEFCIAAGTVFSREAGERLLDVCLSTGETAVTGRGAPQWLLNRGDYITSCQALRHPYQTEGLMARQGIEY